MGKIGWILAVIGAFVGFSALIYRNDALGNSGWNTHSHLEIENMVENSKIALIIGIFIILIGVLIVIAKYVTKKNNVEYNLLNTRKCLKCGNIVKIDEHFCSCCGTDLSHKDITEN